MLDTATPQIARVRQNYTIRTFKDCRSFLEVLIDEVKTRGENVYSQQTKSSKNEDETVKEVVEQPADLPAPTIGAEITPKSMYSLPKIRLSDSELMWLQIISKQFLSGYLADVDRLKKSLHAQGKWPRNFRPSEIDYRLFQRENIPTLLGI